MGPWCSRIRRWPRRRCRRWPGTRLAPPCAVCWLGAAAVTGGVDAFGGGDALAGRSSPPRRRRRVSRCRLCWWAVRRPLEQLLDQVDDGAPRPALVIGMPVGFVGVPESKRRLASTSLDQIRLEGTRGGAGLVAAAVNALLRASEGSC